MALQSIPGQQSQINYVGPYSPEAYKAAGMIAGGGAGAPYNSSIIQGGQQILAANGGANTGNGMLTGGGSQGPTGGSVLGSSTQNTGANNPANGNVMSDSDWQNAVNKYYQPAQDYLTN